MTTLKMIFAGIGALIFLGLFAAGFNTANHQEISLKACGSIAKTQDVNLVIFTCLAAQHTQSIRKG
jgi:site-specific DNA-cytosine methylase